MARLKINIAPSLQRLDLLVKGYVNTKFMGNYSSAFKGQGLEFSNYRAYTPSDDANRIDWKTSNRAQELLVKEFVEERNLNIIFVLDVSSRMMLGSVSKLKCEYTAELIASFANTILKAGDFVGLTMFSDRIVKNIPADNGMKHFHVISDSLSDLSLYGGGSNIKKVLQHAIKNFEETSLVILISDFIDEENFSEELRIAAKKFDLMGIMIRDPIDINLPEGAGQVLIEDPVTKERMLISPNKLRSYYAIETRAEISFLNRIFKNAGADFLLLYTNRSFVEDLIAFFKKRESKWR